MFSRSKHILAGALYVLLFASCTRSFATEETQKQIAQQEEAESFLKSTFGLVGSFTKTSIQVATSIALTSALVTLISAQQIQQYRITHGHYPGPVTRIAQKLLWFSQYAGYTGQLDAENFKEDIAPVFNKIYSNFLPQIITLLIIKVGNALTTVVES